MATLNIGSNQTRTIDESNIQDGGDYTSVSLANNSHLIVDGVDVSLSGIAVNALSSATITSTNGAYTSVNTLAGLNIGSSLTYQIDGNSTIELGTGLNAGLLSSTTIAFTGDGNGTLALAPGLNLNILSSTQITGFGVGDQIDFGGNATSIQYTPNGSNTGGTLTFYNGGIPVGSVNLTGEYDPSLFEFDPETGVVGYACFLRGTRIATPTGEVSVEDLRAGDKVLTFDCRVATVKWVGHRTLRRHAIPEEKRVQAMPVRILKGALGENIPHRDLVVSPWHHMYFEGSLIPAVLLVNGKTIVQDFEMESIEYFHIELDSFDVILAEGAPSESYLDTGNRAMFENAQTSVVLLHPDFTRERREKARAASGYPVVRDGKLLREVRRRLLARAEAVTGLVRSKSANLRLLHEGVEVRPTVNGRFHRFELAEAPSSDLHLLSRMVVKREASEHGLTDMSYVGVGVSELVVKAGKERRKINLDDPALASFLPAERYNDSQRRWSTAQSFLPASLFEGLSGPVTIQLKIENGSIRYWTDPQTEEQQVKAA